VFLDFSWCLSVKTGQNQEHQVKEYDIEQRGDRVPSNGSRADCCWKAGKSAFSRSLSASTTPSILELSKLIKCRKRMSGPVYRCRYARNAPISGKNVSISRPCVTPKIWEVPCGKELLALGLESWKKRGVGKPRMRDGPLAAYVVPLAGLFMCRDACETHHWPHSVLRGSCPA
jgi:hypothetical protein